jgi:hypothetical protein
MRVVEDWRGTATGAIRESVTFIPVAALQYEEALVRACSTGNTGNVSKVLKTHGVLAKFAYAILLTLIIAMVSIHLVKLQKRDE